jgi:hypothetical protein
MISAQIRENFLEEPGGWFTMFSQPISSKICVVYLRMSFVLSDQQLQKIFS